MWMTPEDARSDFVLAAATTLFGFVVVELVSRLPLYPAGGFARGVLSLVWIFALTGLVPLLLARYRNQGAAGFGLEENQASAAAGLLIALPLAVVWFLRVIGRASITESLLGQLAFGVDRDPTVSGFGGGSAADAALEFTLGLGLVAAVAAGGALLFSFLTTRAREGFRRTEIRLVEGLRTFGMAAVGAALLLGLLAAIGTVELVGVILNVSGLAVMVLLTDRLVTPTAGTSRATLLAPAIVALALHVFQLQGALLFGLYSGVLAGGVVMVMAALVETRRYAWTVVPIAVLGALYPTCLSPLPFGLSPATC